MYCKMYEQWAVTGAQWQPEAITHQPKTHQWHPPLILITLHYSCTFNSD